MNKAKQNMMLLSGIALVVAFFLSYILNTTFEPPYGWYYYVLPIVGFFINVVGFIVSTSKMSIRNINTQLSSLFAVKFFAYLILVLIYFLFVKEKSFRLIFIGLLFIVYILNTTLLIRGVLKYQKSIAQ